MTTSRPDEIAADRAARRRLIQSAVCAVGFGFAAALPAYSARSTLDMQFGRTVAASLFAVIAASYAVSFAATIVERVVVDYIAGAARSSAALVALSAYAHDPRPAAIVVYLLIVAGSISDVLDLVDDERSRHRGEDAEGVEA